MANKGLKTFAGDEASNLLAGQCAAYYWNPAGTGAARVITCGEGDLVNVDFIFAIKSDLGTTNTEVSARSLIGDDLSLTGTYGTHPSQVVTVRLGDIIYGCFDKIYSNSNGLLLYMKLK